MEKDKKVILLIVIFWILIVIVPPVYSMYLKELERQRESEQIKSLKIIQGKIAYVSISEEGSYIYLTDINGSNRIRLVEGWYPSISPDGTKIAFSTPPSRYTAESHIYVMNFSDLKPIKITSVNRWNIQPAWKPDGTKIAFAGNKDAPADHDLSIYDIYVINVDGTNMTRLTTEGGFDPKWSHDGKKIAFTRKVRPGVFMIFVMNADGTNQTSLTEGVQPSWSPDDKKIFYVDYVKWGGKILGQIFSINVDSTNKTMLTDPSLGVDNGEPECSPDGRKVVFVSGTQPERYGTIFVMNVDGTNRTQLTHDPKSYNTHPTWSPLVPSKNPG
jgi:Tol biopolymer transport system component